MTPVRMRATILALAILAVLENQPGWHTAALLGAVLVVLWANYPKRR